MIVSFHPCFEADANVVLGSRKLDAADFDLIRRATAIILPQGRPQEIYEACSGSVTHLFPTYDVRFKYPGKMGQSRLFEDLGCPHPNTLRWSEVNEFKEIHPYAKDFPHERPFFIKDDKSHE